MSGTNAPPEDGPRIYPAPQYPTYVPGEAISDVRAHVGRPVLAFSPALRLMGGSITTLYPDPEREGEVLYDVAVLGIGAKGPRLDPILARGLRLGSLNDPQPNTFVFN